jgi:hypothetical protein
VKIAALGCFHKKTGGALGAAGSAGHSKPLLGPAIRQRLQTVQHGASPGDMVISRAKRRTHEGSCRMSIHDNVDIDGTDHAICQSRLLIDARIGENHLTFTSFRQIFRRLDKKSIGDHIINHD